MDNLLTEDVVARLQEAIATGDLEAGDVLAYLAHAHHEDVTPLTNARDEDDAEIGSVGVYAYLLKERIYNNL